MKGQINIVVLGDIIYDCFMWTTNLPKRGETVVGYNSAFFSGGKGANQAVQAAKLGANVFLIGKVGDDIQGDFILDELKKNNVNVDYVFIDNSANTGTCCVQVDAQGNNSIITVPSVNYKVTVDEVRTAKKIIETADILMVQLLLKDEVIAEAMKIAVKNDITIILDPAPARKISDKSIIKYADYITPNETEAEFLTKCNRENYNTAEEWEIGVIEKFNMMGTNRLLLTIGQDGVIYSYMNDMFKIPAYSVNAVDCTGAGDSFNAAFAVAIAEKKSLVDAIKYGNAAAAITVMKKGAQIAMPDKLMLECFIKDKCI